MIDFGDIEQAVKDTCDDMQKSGKWSWLATAKSYGGEFDEELLNVVKRFPAIWVTVTGDKPEKISHNKYKYFAKIAILVGASSMRNEEARRHGAGNDIGAYQMLSEVVQRFTETKLSDKISGLAPLELGRSKTIFNTTVQRQSISVISQEFTTHFIVIASDRDREEQDEDVGEIRKIHTDYYYQPSSKSYNDPADAGDVIEIKG